MPASESLSRGPEQPSTKPDGGSILLGRLTLLLGLATFVSAVVLTVRTYMPCPLWDEWSEIMRVAHGAGFSSWNWLWSQHNEHRILIPRLLLLIDLNALGGKNASLFLEIYLVQVAGLVAICYFLERFATYPRSLTLTLEGLFAFCLFHWNQAENLTWAFQISFVLAFAIATVSFLAVAHFERLRYPGLLSAALGFAPLLAAMNVAGGLLIGPVAIAFTIWRGLPVRYILTISALFVITAATYLAGYKSPDPSHQALAELRHGVSIFVYVLTYFGASWTRLLPHKERATCFVSFICLAYIVVRAARDRVRTSNFEWFCMAECLFAIATAFLTALGRLQFGVGQAYAGRYQTPAMLYWASLCALVLIGVWRYRPGKLPQIQAGTLCVLLLSSATFIPMWKALTGRSDRLRSACYAVMHGNTNKQSAKLLYPIPEHITEAVAYLHRVWHQ